MRFLTALVAVSMVSGTAEAANSPFEASGVQPGAFIGARFQLHFGGQVGARPRASLGIAPTRTAVLENGRVETRSGDGFAPGCAPRLTIAGTSVGRAFRPARGETAGTPDKARMSTAGWVAIGTGLLAVAVVGAALWVDEIKDNSD